MDTSQWMQEVGAAAKSMAEIAAPNETCIRSVTERKVRPQKDQALNCPRCHSTNTKFCYYNNYSLTQPRYFCKTCRRYWTEGGTLRNVPVGGGSRKNKKSSSSNSPSLSMATASSIPSHKLPDLNPPTISGFSSRHQNPRSLHDQGQDLSLGNIQAPQDYTHVGIPGFLEFPKFESRDVINSSSCSSASLSTLNFLTSGIAAGGLNSFIPLVQGSAEANVHFEPGFPFNQECKPALAFTFDGVNVSRLYGSSNASQQANLINGKPVFTFGPTKHDLKANEEDQGKVQENSNGYWKGTLGGGSW